MATTALCQIKFQTQLLQKGPTAGTAELWVMLGVLWESKFQKGKNCCTTAARREGWGMWENIFTKFPLCVNLGVVVLFSIVLFHSVWVNAIHYKRLYMVHYFLTSPAKWFLSLIITKMLCKSKIQTSHIFCLW